MSEEKGYYLHFMERTRFSHPATHEQMSSVHSQAAGLLVALSKSLKTKAREGSWDHSRMVREDSSIYESDPDPRSQVPSP